MKRYRLYTEDGPHYRPAVKRIVAQSFESFTLIEGVGLWQGTEEPCLIIEIITDAADADSLVRNLAGNICRTNNQSAILVTTDLVESILITHDGLTDEHRRAIENVADRSANR